MGYEKEWYRKDECDRIIESDDVVDSEFLYKHLNLAFKKGIQLSGIESMTAERDELQSELERVKTENLELQAIACPHMKVIPWEDSQSRKDFLLIKSLKSSHESLLAKLPVNADGDVVIIGEEQWAVEYQVFAFEVIQIRKTKNGYELREKDGHNWWPAKSCHSTAESCRKSIEGESHEL